MFLRVSEKTFEVVVIEKCSPQRSLKAKVGMCDSAVAADVFLCAIAPLLSF